MVAEGLPAQVACRVLEVSESGFYAWRSRPPSARAIRHAWLTDLIAQVHADFRTVYGYRRVHAELTLGHGLIVGAEAVWLLMRKTGLQGLSGRPKYRRIPNQPTAGDLVDRNFARSEPDRLWVTDITEHPTREGKVYCAVVLDTYSRRVVGWSIDSSPNAALVTNALGMAIAQRNPTTATVIHSDQGTPGSSPPGPSPAGRSTPASCRPWVRSVIALITPSSSRSGVGCRSNCSIVSAGAPGSNWPMRSSST
jgi:putative transposase